MASQGMADETVSQTLEGSSWQYRDIPLICVLASPGRNQLYRWTSRLNRSCRRVLMRRRPLLGILFWCPSDVYADTIEILSIYSLGNSWWWHSETPSGEVSEPLRQTYHSTAQKYLPDFWRRGVRCQHIPTCLSCLYIDKTTKRQKQLSANYCFSCRSFFP